MFSVTSQWGRFKQSNTWTPSSFELMSSHSERGPSFESRGMLIRPLQAPAQLKNSSAFSHKYIYIHTEIRGVSKRFKNHIQIEPTSRTNVYSYVPQCCITCYRLNPTINPVQGVELSHTAPLKAHLVWQVLRKNTKHIKSLKSHHELCFLTMLHCGRQ